LGAAGTRKPGWFKVDNPNGWPGRVSCVRIALLKDAAESILNKGRDRAICIRLGRSVAVRVIECLKTPWRSRSVNEKTHFGHSSRMIFHRVKTTIINDATWTTKTWLSFSKSSIFFPFQYYFG
jgi:hypothetical protein